MIRIKHIGFLGISCYNQNVMEAWSFGICTIFNLAMLAKQVWRLLPELQSLCARVLRAKYYSDGCLLKAKAKSGSSFTWQSVLASLECLKRAIFGERVMDRKLISGMIVGYQVAGI